jgi:hypothetical protein
MPLTRDQIADATQAPISASATLAPGPMVADAQFNGFLSKRSHGEMVLPRVRGSLRPDQRVVSPNPASVLPGRFDQAV